MFYIRFFPDVVNLYFNLPYTNKVTVNVKISGQPCLTGKKKLQRNLNCVGYQHSSYTLHRNR